MGFFAEELLPNRYEVRAYTRSTRGLGTWHLFDFVVAWAEIEMVGYGGFHIVHHKRATCHY